MNLFFQTNKLRTLASLLFICLGTAISAKSALPRSILELDSQNADTFQVTLQTVDKKKRFQKGESIRYAVSANKNCYFCLLSFQSDGSWTVLYPNAFDTEIILGPDAPAIIPDPTVDDYEFVVDAPFGTDTVCVVASSVEAELSLKVRQLTEQEPMYVSLDRGIFPVKTSSRGNPNMTSVLWDVDWILIETSETASKPTSAFLTKRSATVVFATGLLLIGFSVLLLRKKLL